MREVLQIPDSDRVNPALRHDHNPVNDCLHAIDTIRIQQKYAQLVAEHWRQKKVVVSDSSTSSIGSISTSGCTMEVEKSKV
jgi:hypothetical protein